MNILSIDPGTIAGCALWINGKLVDSRQFNCTTPVGRDTVRYMVDRLDIESDDPKNCLVVIEGLGYRKQPIKDANGKTKNLRRYDTEFKYGIHCGYWDEAANCRRIRCEYLHPSKWQRIMLKFGKREELKARSMLFAKAESGKVMKENEADAFNMGRWVLGELRVKRDPWRKG